MDATAENPLAVPDAASWHDWLARHHASATEAHVLVGRQSTKRTSLRSGDALDTALCFGWIDSVRRRWDVETFVQRYSPRRPGSPWSAVNVAKVEALLTAHRMAPAGMAEVAAAQADGRWAAAYPAQRDAVTPDDLAAAIAADPVADARWSDLGRTEQYAVMLPVFRAVGGVARERAVLAAVRRLARDA